MKTQKPWNITYFQENISSFIICDKCHCNDNKIFKENESIEVLKALGLITHNINQENALSQT